MGTTSKSSVDRDSVWIAGTTTRKDWKDLAEKIAAAQHDKDDEKVKSLFKTASKEFLTKRLETRYFRPINAIKRIKVPLGQGFAIVAIFCSLIEFLQTLRDGTVFINKFKFSTFDGKKKIKYAELIDPANPRKIKDEELYRYGDGFSRAIFEEFFKVEEFKCLSSEDQDFYGKVRCAILHNAMIEEPWVIKVHSTCDSSVQQRDLVKDEGGRISLYRDELVRRLQQYIDQYCQDLLTDQALQAAFIRKFNSL